MNNTGKQLFRNIKRPWYHLAWVFFFLPYEVKAPLQLQWQKNKLFYWSPLSEVSDWLPFLAVRRRVQQSAMRWCHGLKDDKTFFFPSLIWSKNNQKTKKPQNGNSALHVSPAYLILQLNFHISVITPCVKVLFCQRRECSLSALKVRDKSSSELQCEHWCVDTS